MGHGNGNIYLIILGYKEEHATFAKIIINKDMQWTSMLISHAYFIFTCINEFFFLPLLYSRKIYSYLYIF